MHQDIIKDKVNDGYKPVTLEAHDLVFGDRQKSYGHPLDDFSCTATCWDAYLKHRMHSKLRANWKGSDTDLLVFLRWFDEYFGVDAEDFGPMMILAKVSRQANSPKRDNMTDSAGYAETTERVIFERERRRDPFRTDEEPLFGQSVTQNVSFYTNGQLPVQAAEVVTEEFRKSAEAADKSGRL
jgi:hypothetical protein